MFDYVTELKVCDAKRIVSDALIGSFKFDLGLVYDEEDHCYIHKWLLLTDPLDLSSELKVSQADHAHHMCVIIRTCMCKCHTVHNYTF